MNFPTFPAFGEKEFTSNKTNERCHAYNISYVTQDDFYRYRKYIEKCGYLEKELRDDSFHLFGAFLAKDGSSSIFMNYYDAIGEINIVTELGADYFSFSATPGCDALAPQITQIKLEDFGMSYAIRLRDGRYIVFDGGREFVPDADKLFECIKRGSGLDKPTVAAWIMTHPHSDHFHCFRVFVDKYADEVEIERILFNFPDCDDTEHYPSLTHADARFEENSSASHNIPLMLERIERIGAKVYTPHTGQIYDIADARCEILATLDDTIHLTTNVNATSVVVRMTLGGQTILWASDAPFSDTRLPEKFGSYLKSDILQVPHHGFVSGKQEAEIAGYELIRPSVCLLPVADFNAYLMMCTYRKSTRHLFTNVGVEQIISGDDEVTLTLPYTPPAYAKRELASKVQSGLDSSGATTWVFTGLSTDEPEDMRFSILNMTANTATVTVELYFTESSQYVRGIRTQAPSYSIKTINLTDPSVVDPEYLYFEWRTLAIKGIPEHSPFAVRFISDLPIVISHSKHTPSHKANISIT